MWKQWLIALVLVAIAIGGAFLYQNLDEGTAAQSGGERPASAVNTILPKMEMVRDVVNAVGSLRALNAVELTTEVSGRVVELNLETGRRVEQGKYSYALMIARPGRICRSSRLNWRMPGGNMKGHSGCVPTTVFPSPRWMS